VLLFITGIIILEINFSSYTEIIMVT